MAMLKSAGGKTLGLGSTLGLKRWTHAIARPMPLDSAIFSPSSTAAVSPPPFSLPESDRRFGDSNRNRVGFEFPSFSFSGGSMELMAVPKKKTSKHKRGIRNGPKALKPIPVIIRCKACGRVKLPHFFCCSGERGNTGEHNG